MSAAVAAAQSRLQGRRKKPEAAPWRQPELATDFLLHRWVLAFDATLTNCGWVMFKAGMGGLTISDKGTIRPKTSRTGYLGTWDKASQLRRQVDHVIATWFGQDADVVVEAPAVHGSRTESSLIAGSVVWSSAEGDCHVVSATHVSAVLLGDARVKSEERKPLIREAVIRYCPEAAGRNFNEHERDALATGLVHLHDIKGKAAA